MDPSIVKLLEEDEDESMHSGADVEAFQAALNRDIEGGASTPQPSDSNTAVFSQGSNPASSQSLAQWPCAGQEGNTNFQNQQALQNVQQQQQPSSEIEQKQQGAVVARNKQQAQQQNDIPQEPNRLLPQQRQSQDDRQQGVAEQVSAQVPQMSMVQNTEKTSIPTHEPERPNNQDSESQYMKLQKMSNQQASGTEQQSGPTNRGKQVPFAILLPALVPQLDKDRAMQLHTLYAKLKKNEIAKDGFVRHMRDIVGDQMLRLAVNKLQLQMSSDQFPLQSQAAVRQNGPRMPSIGAGSQQFSGQNSLSQLHQKGPNAPANPSRGPSTAVPMQTNSSYPSVENHAKKSQEMDRPSDSRFGVLGSQISSTGSTTVNQERDRSSAPVQGLNKQQQHLNFPQTSFSIYGSSNYNPYSAPSVNTSGSSLKPQTQDPQMRQIAHPQSIGSNPGGGSTMNMVSAPKFERQTSTNDSNRLQGGSVSHFSSSTIPWQASSSKEPNPGTMSSVTYPKQEPVDLAAGQQQKPHLSACQGLSTAVGEQGKAITITCKEETSEKQSSRIGFSTPTSMVPPSLVSPSISAQTDSSGSLGSRNPSVPSLAGANTRTPQKKPSVGQKKPLETLGSSPPPSSKKQKVSGGALLDQSIEQLNDVTAVSGVNLREEEEQLLSGSKDDSRVSEASRRVVQEEEERLILQKIPLKKKLAEIMAKSGLKNVSNDVERCLSLCAEERVRGLICNLIRLSKQRVDAEKPRHRTIITTDVRQQIMMINRKATEEWEKRQAEAEKLRKLNEPEPETAVDGDKEKDDGRVKSVKVNKEEDDKMRATAANVAARAAVGGDDMLSKWQLMAEQARQKREGGPDAASGSQAGKDVNRRPPSSASEKNTKDNQESEKRGPGQLSPLASGASRKFGRSQVAPPQTKVARAISVKDVIAALEREPQMSRSTLVYRLYERIRTEGAAE